MRVHHLNCGTWHPRGGRLVNGEGRLPPRMVCHCLLVETENGLVLVDSGFGLEDVARPRQRVGRLLLFAGRPSLDPEETAVRQVQRLGFAPADVRHIVLTHLDLDHAGGLADFPEASVHVLAAEHLFATRPRTWIQRMRYREAHWAHGPSWVTYEPTGERWFGFECVRPLEGLPPEILLVPLAGHTPGHCAVAVKSDGPWILHAGDAYYHHHEMDLTDPRSTPALSLFQWLTEVDGRERQRNQARLRDLVRGNGDEIRLISAHDPEEYDALARGLG